MSFTRRIIGVALAGVVFQALAADTRQWKSLAEAGLHDPGNPALPTLQDPGIALRLLPPDTAGNMVNWVRALRDGYIKPRTNLLETTKVQVLDQDVVMKNTAELPYVQFPHLAHTEWLECSNCHEWLFKSKAGATPVNMFEILQGEYCGRCHGAVAFPLTECARCHSVARNAANSQAPK
jgi:c(7)-type cytochrome triheme protein